MKNFAELSPAAERIVDAAEELVQHVGFNGFSYEDISLKVGIRKPSIHHHFQTKVELVVVMTQRYIHRFELQLGAIEQGQTSSIERLQAYANVFAKTFETDRRLCVCGMLGAEADALPDVIRAEIQRFFRLNAEWLERIIAKGQSAGELRSEQPASNLGALWLGALEGSMLVGRGVSGLQGPTAVADTLLVGWSK
ncbi:TetR/AcrR family transcriptional regulator [Comamonas testosteroni]|uniref:TetR/AcrR family transcriptional regulator n=1 Tax=Comamonas testosteroni TaxID=285 RepID=UPI003899C8F0